MSTPKQILDDVREALGEIAGMAPGDSDTEIVSLNALAKLDRLEMVEGRAWRMEGEPHFTVTNLYPPDTHDALLLTKGDT